MSNRRTDVHPVAWRGPPLQALPDDAELEMRHAIGLAEPGPFQLRSLRELVEQPTAPAEQDVDHVDPDLVHEPLGEELLVDVRAAPINPIRFSPATSWGS
jgi:hypothetical protein